MAAPEEIIVQNEFIKMALAGFVSEADQKPKFVRFTPDRSLAVWDQIVGFDGTNQRVVKVESTGELALLFHGKDSAGNIDAIRTSDEKRIEVEVFTATTDLLTMVLAQLRLMTLHLDSISQLGATIADVEGD